MRKILLIAVVLFSLGSMAQKPFGFIKNVKTLDKNLKVNNLMKMPSASINNMAKAPAKAPEGESHTYYLDCYNTVYGFGAVPEFHKAINIIYGTDNKVYIENMIYPSMFNTYIEGELDGNTITLKNGQSIGTYYSYNIILCSVSVTTNTDGTLKVTPEPSTDFTLTVDNEYGTIQSGNNSFIGLVTDDYAATLAFAGVMQFVPENLFPAADEHEYTYDHQGYSTPLETKNGTVQIINLGDACYIKGLLPEVDPDSWTMASYENGTLSMSLPQIVTEDVASAFVDFNNGGEIIYDPVSFTYNAASDSYTMSKYTLTNLFVSEDDSGNLGLAYSDSYDNLKIKKTTTGINKVEGNDADVVSTEYFDLSGRRISNAQKGINVKVMKFSDGTTKTVKVIK